jgi:preprotein translocase subunit SecE
MKGFRLDRHKMTILFIVLVMIGLFSILYYIYDLIYPNHFVADMYGMEVMYRVSILIMIALPMFIGLLLIVIGRNKRKNNLTKTGIVLATICSFVLILLSTNVYFSRHEDEIRKTYQHKSTDELIRIASSKNDQYAIYEIISRKDSSAVPALCQILLDENQNIKLRIESAHALGQIGGDIGRDALEKAMTRSKNSFLTDTIKYAIEAIDRSKDREVR